MYEKFLFNLGIYILYMYEIFILIFCYNHHAKYWAYCMPQFTELEREVILLFGVALGLLPHSVEHAQVACVASWGGKRVNKTDFLGSSRIWRIRPVLLCPGLILGAFDSNAEEAWVCSSDYVAQDTIFIYFNPMYWPECLMKATRSLQLHCIHHAALLLQGELTDRIFSPFSPIEILNNNLVLA